MPVTGAVLGGCRRDSRSPLLSVIGESALHPHPGLPGVVDNDYSYNTSELFYKQPKLFKLTCLFLKNHGFYDDSISKMLSAQVWVNPGSQTTARSVQPTHLNLRPVFWAPRNLPEPWSLLTPRPRTIAPKESLSSAALPFSFFLFFG